MIKIALNLDSRGDKKIELSSQGTYNFQILGNETLIIADYKYTKIFNFAILDIKLLIMTTFCINFEPSIE